MILNEDDLYINKAIQDIDNELNINRIFKDCVDVKNKIMVEKTINLKVYGEFTISNRFTLN